MAKYGVQGENERETEYGTPRRFVQPLEEAVGGFDLDPASGAEDSPHATTTYTVNDDGLRQSWFGNVWCNPPFSNKDDWLQKAVSEHTEGNTDLILMLLPVDTSTGWFHRHVTMCDALWFKQGRLSFDGDRDWGANFGIMLAIFGEPPKDLLDILEQRGEVFLQDSRYQTTEQITLEYTEKGDKADQGGSP